MKKPKLLVIVAGVLVIFGVLIYLFGNFALSGSLGEEKACVMANAYLKKMGNDGMGNIYPPQSPDKECKNFNLSGNTAMICVGGKTVVALQSYQKEGWKAYDIMLGAGCE
jgi:hypothetical protein